MENEAKDLVLGRYRIDNEYKVHNIISELNKDGDGHYDPFNGNEVIPFWGVLVTTFEGLQKSNQNYILQNLPMDENELTVKLKKYWVFWFSDGDLNTQKELFFTGSNGKRNSLIVLDLFNTLLEKNIERVIKATKTEIERLEA